jgi:hypothetical protein
MLKFELDILSGIKKDYEDYISENKQIYENTKIYFRYINHRNKLSRKTLEYKRIIEDYNSNDNNYPLKLVNYKFVDTANHACLKGAELEEDIRFIENKMKSLKYDIEIYKKVDQYINEVYRLNQRVIELEEKIKIFKNIIN